MDTKQAATAERNRARGLSALAVTVAAIFATVASSSEENQATRADEASDTSADPEANAGEAPDSPAQETFAVGDLVALGDWQVRVHGVTDPFTSTDQFLEPAPGNRWVAVDAEVTNNSTSPQTVSSILCFELLDNTNVAYTMTIAPDAGEPPDGEVTPGGSRRGTLVYELPEGASGLHLTFKCDLFSSGSAVISLG